MPSTVRREAGSEKLSNSSEDTRVADGGAGIQSRTSQGYLLLCEHLADMTQKHSKGRTAAKWATTVRGRRGRGIKST